MTSVHTCVHTYSRTLYSGHLGTRRDCPDYEGVLISEVEVGLQQSMEIIWFQWHVSYKRGVCNSGVWIRGVSAIQWSGLEGCLQFRGLD